LLSTRRAVELYVLNVAFERRQSITMATRLFYTACTLLLAMMSWKSTAQLVNGRCEKITIPLCTGMKYNMTRMPNLVGIANQNEAALQVRTVHCVADDCSTQA